MTDSRGALADELEAHGRITLEALRGVAADAWDRGAYENGWNARQILAHLAAIEWTYPRLLDVARAPQAESGREASGGGIDAYNARQVAKRESESVDGLLDELERNRASLVETVRAVSPELLDTPVRSTGGRTGTVEQVLRSVAIEHVQGHVRDILGER